MALALSTYFGGWSPRSIGSMIECDSQDFWCSRSPSTYWWFRSVCRLHRVRQLMDKSLAYSRFWAWCSQRISSVPILPYQTISWCVRTASCYLCLVRPRLACSSRSDWWLASQITAPDCWIRCLCLFLSLGSWSLICPTQIEICFLAVARKVCSGLPLSPWQILLIKNIYRQ